MNAEVRLYDRLFRNEDPTEVADGDTFLANLNPDSLTVLAGCKLEPSLRSATPGSRYQFERVGYFCVDVKNSKPGAPVFNRIVSLRDTWAKITQRESSR
jgi:glutaminyl-tRNA synthetase